jgi:ABC-2 type transport system ATP-binding protein
MIRTEKLSKSYGSKTALIDLDLRVEPGEILGFLGPNGAGKSTTVKILTGLMPSDSGRAIVAGHDIAVEPLEVKKRIGYVPEQPALYDALTADEYLDVIGCLYHLDPAAAKTRREELLQLFDLSAVKHQRLKEFSKGMRQKVVIASALMHRPDVLILDEPLDGLDANTALVMKELLRKLAAQGKTIMFSSHILEVVERICTRIFIIDKGRYVTDGTAQKIREETGTATLDEAFGKLTGVRDVGKVTADFLAALERV